MNNQNSIFILLLFIFFIVVPFIVALDARARRNSKPRFRYTATPCVMTPAEACFFLKLVELYSGAYYVFPQIHLSSLLSGKVRGQNWTAAFMHINGKSVDFVLVDKRNLRSVCSIECDDRTHSHPDRMTRDDEVNKIFAQAGIPLCRISNYTSKDLMSIKNAIEKCLQN